MTETTYLTTLIEWDNFVKRLTNFCENYPEGSTVHTVGRRSQVERCYVRPDYLQVGVESPSGSLEVWGHSDTRSRIKGEDGYINLVSKGQSVKEQTAMLAVMGVSTTVKPTICLLIDGLSEELCPADMKRYKGT